MKKKNKQSSIEFQDESIAINLQEFFNEITSMLGVEQILLFTKTGETLYSYNRWGEFHRGIEEKEAYNLIDMLIKKIKKITENNSISQTILKTKKNQIIILFSEKGHLFINCTKKAYLPKIILLAHQKSEIIFENI